MRFLIFLLFPLFAHAQHPVLQNDTVYYKNAKIFVGDTVHLAYGSGASKEFVFVYMGSGLTGVTKLDASWAKYDVKIDKISHQGSKITVRGFLLDAKGANTMGSNKIFIQPEGAIDNNEVGFSE